MDMSLYMMQRKRKFSFNTVPPIIVNMEINSFLLKEMIDGSRYFTYRIADFLMTDYA